MGFENAIEFERWWGRNGNIFESEALAIEEVMPDSTDDAIVIGNGTGKFALRLGIPFGVDPSESMCKLAKKRALMPSRELPKTFHIPTDSFHWRLW